MTFVSLVLMQFVMAYNSRSGHQSVLVRPCANKWLNLAVLCKLVLLAGVVDAPFLRKPFRTFSLSSVAWCTVTAAPRTISRVVWLTKRWQRDHATAVHPPLEPLPRQHAMTTVPACPRALRIYVTLTMQGADATRGETHEADDEARWGPN